MKLPKLDDLGTREKIMLSVAGLALCGMLLSLLSLPFVSKIEAIDKETRDVEIRLNIVRSYLNSDARVTGEYIKMENMLGRSLSDAESIADMKEDIELMARGAGLTYDPPSDRDPVAKDDSSPWREYVVELARCEGSMDSLVAFVGSLESSAVVYRVEKMSVAPSKSGTGVTATIVISRIMLPPEGSAVEPVEES